MCVIIPLVCDMGNIQYFVDVAIFGTVIIIVTSHLISDWLRATSVIQPKLCVQETPHLMKTICANSATCDSGRSNLERLKGIQALGGKGISSSWPYFLPPFKYIFMEICDMG